MIPGTSRCAENRLKGPVACFDFASGCIEAVGNQVQQCPSDFLRIKVARTSLGVKVLLERYAEARFFRSGTVVGEVQALPDQRVNVGGSTLWPDTMKPSVLPPMEAALSLIHSRVS